MTQNEFQVVFERQIRRCAETLQNKTAEYTNNSPDRLSAFKAAASLQDCTPEEALAGMLAKHLVSLYDMCSSMGKSFSLCVWEEKITDALNYLFLLRALVEEVNHSDE